MPEDNLLRNGLGDDSYFIWSDKIIPYVINEGFNETNKQNIQEAIDEYNRLFKGCLTWKPKTDEVRKLVQSNKIVFMYYFYLNCTPFQSVYVEFLNAGSCYSKVGRVFWPFPLPQSIHIGKCAHLVGHIKHEMMHTLGFYHEHSRSDRDDYIKINWENIAEGRADQFLTYR